MSGICTYYARSDRRRGASEAHRAPIELCRSRPWGSLDTDSAPIEIAGDLASFVINPRRRRSVLNDADPVLS